MMKSAATTVFPIGCARRPALTNPRDTVQLLHLLGYVYGCHGQAKRGAAYLLIAAQLSPDDVGVLRTLSYLLTLDGEADKALETISRLEVLDDRRDPALHLLKSRALYAAGRQEEARQAFNLFVKMRAEIGA